MSDRSSSNAFQDRQLRRLETVIDAIYALVIVLLVAGLPKPAEWGEEALPQLREATLATLRVAVVGVLIAIVYWNQNNRLFEHLRRTNAVHSGLAIGQVFLLLLFMYTVELGMAFPERPMARVLQSVVTALMGFAATGAWRYARGRGRLVDEAVSAEDSRDIGVRSLAEPLSALVTIPFAFVSPLLWELAWLSYVPIARFLTRRALRGEAARS